jgi:prepilin-type N-terminal cleavage/methylation domain-containing protein
MEDINNTVRNTMYKNNKKGFTLVELLVTLGLVGIIISVVMSFFIANIKNYKSINNDAELQYQSQYILNFMTNKILQAKNIDSVLDFNGIDVIDSEVEKQISEITFLGVSDAQFKFEISGDTITYSDSTSSNTLGSNVEGVWITPITTNSTDIEFGTTKSIKIRLKLSIDNRSYEAQQKIYMRNN